MCIYIYYITSCMAVQGYVPISLELKRSAKCIHKIRSNVVELAGDDTLLCVTYNRQSPEN
jgi:hypothetical protein